MITADMFFSTSSQLWLYLADIFGKTFSACYPMLSNLSKIEGVMETVGVELTYCHIAKTILILFYYSTHSTPVCGWLILYLVGWATNVNGSSNQQLEN